MANQTGSGDDESLFWDIFKLVAFIVGALVLLAFAWQLIKGLLVPILVIAALFVGYKMFIEDDDTNRVEPVDDPPLLEQEAHSETEDILEDDPLEKEFEELEQNEPS